MKLSDSSGQRRQAANHLDPPCILECGGTVAHWGFMWSRSDIKLRRSVGTCRICGHIQVRDRPSVEEYRKINNRFFENKFARPPDPRRREKLEDRVSETVSRLAPFTTNGGGVFMDVGAGDAWCAGVARQLGIRYVAVEQAPRLQRLLQENGIEVIGDDPMELGAEWEKRADVIMLRHVLEHLLDPISTLQSLARCLSPSGCIYVAVPSIVRTSAKRGFVTDFLRPTHMSYFTPDKLKYTLIRAGLIPIALKDDTDLWAIARCGTADIGFEGEYEKNLNLMNKLASCRTVRDLLNRCMILVKRHVMRRDRGARGEQECVE